MSDEAREAETTDEATASLTFRNLTLTVPLEYDDWTVDFLESLEEGKTVGIVRGALGPAQWQRVKALNLKARDLDELAGKIASAMGFKSAGESSASSA